jgi:membrane carboxypeptidase/penicillin-binding protein
MFPAGGFSTKPYYLSRIEDKNGNVLDRFDTERKEVISQNTAYTMCRMMQGTVDIGTAAGMRDRLGLAEMGVEPRALLDDLLSRYAAELASAAHAATKVKTVS